ncbi:MAG: S1C family serine protease [Rhodospirillales bacterium]|nr:S1C family serine protease [Rhodospirillales bacterium]MDH3790537.1 S1C family serine protease [Rhodospirillales bacterium]MDH3917290.1 S1C family serine protease [Rhodospirillales bacterium]MDH3967754.1 S1C family serine protease [Rhodospirillales bacterium]
MTEPGNWEVPSAVQPKAEEVVFDLDKTLASVVSLRAEIPEDAFTAGILGTEREGNGVVIGDGGLVLTIGYLITEADSVWLVSEQGTAAPAHVVGYDQSTGLGLVQALGRLDVPAIALGASGELTVGDEVIVAAQGGRRHALKARVMAKREFAGYWEYVLDEAIFTAPAHPNWSGAALIGPDGGLRGIGSLLVQEARAGGPPRDCNMFVPIDLLDAIRDDLLKFGKAGGPPRPWLGMYTAEAEGKLHVAGLAKDAPADLANVRVGDIVLEVGGAPVAGLAEMFRRIWALGPAGTVIPLTVAREGEELSLRVHSADRSNFLKSPELQ